MSALSQQVIEPTVDKSAGKVKRASDYIIEAQKFRTREDMVTWKQAIDSADNVNQYNREDMHRIYRECYADPHLFSQWVTRKLKTISQEYQLKPIGSEDEDEAATKLIDTAWFTDLMDEILESRLYGFRLIELGPIIDKKPTAYQASNGRFYDPVNVINPDLVKPEWHLLVQQASSTIGLRFDDPIFKSLIFVGKHHDYGIMEKCVKYVLFKNNCAENWSEWAEVFGMDIRVGKTDAQDDARNAFRRQLKEMGASGYGIIDPDDSIEFAGTARTDAFKVYQEFMNTIDHNISKAIFGQDVVSNNTGQVVGKVGENVSNLYGENDSVYLARQINDVVLPKLVELGIAELAGKVFQFNQTEQLTLDQESQIDLRVSQMGYTPAKAFLEKKYNIQLEEKEDPVLPGAPGQPGAKPPAKKPTMAEKVNWALKVLYEDAGSVE